MNNTNACRTGLVSLIVSAALFGSGPATAAQPNMYDGNWHCDFTLYGWFPGVTGDFNFNLPPGVILPPPGLGESHSGSVSPNSYLSSLQFGAMLAGEARKGNAAIITDLIYADLASLTSKVKSVTGPGGAVTLPVDADVNLGLKATVWTLAGSYTVARGREGTLDVLGGFRYAGIRTSLDWTFSGPNGVLSKSGGTSERLNLWDGIVGVRGAVSIGSDGKWYLPYYADIGAGNDSNWTWQAYAGVGYRFDWDSVVLAFRNLSYDQSGDKHLQSVS